METNCKIVNLTHWVYKIKEILKSPLSDHFTFLFVLDIPRNLIKGQS